MNEALRRTRDCLDGLSVGDALGKTWSTWSGAAASLLSSPLRVPPAPWRYTDDTVMAMAIVEILERHGAIDPDRLAAELAARFRAEPERGYGAGAFWLLSRLAAGHDWRQVSVELFRGGSFGNGAAMRVAPIGAYFAPDAGAVVDGARASAVVTHAHPEGQAGAIAVAIAAATGAAGGVSLDAVLEHTPVGAVRLGIERVRSLAGASPERAAAGLGDGREVTARDTVPLALWCAVEHSNDYENAIVAALRATAAPEADRDTVLAMTGGIVAAAAPPPKAWLDAREPLARVALDSER